ncbi:GNAT family N-acetyltransferase [Terriglobus roseus]|uniref:Tagatose 1,6-diphosphate aldolase n=1 Tax=Terriglobus roseus TaxID=392734 RepID=A0A1G7P8E1_9BACT|nr:GNAT family N-acetyltransferase [Terriglobus roseus]SDF82575.1 tagatose 1,6-diphosphate aldolase [Terriglobus roseus]
MQAILSQPLQEVDGQLSLEYLGTDLSDVHKVPVAAWLMRNRAGDEVGGIRFRLESTQHVLLYAGHIGYNVHPKHRGNHYAARAVRLLVPIAKAIKIDPLWITCDPENMASRRTLEWIGADYVETVNVLYNNAVFLAGHPRKRRYRLSTSIATNDGQIPSEEKP